LDKREAQQALEGFLNPGKNLIITFDAEHLREKLRQLAGSGGGLLHPFQEERCMFVKQVCVA
jgi:hypothetical protein